MSDKKHPCSRDNLNETEILAHVVNNSYEGFIPVQNATTDLDSYDMMSIVKKRKRKRNEKDKESPGCSSMISRMKFKIFGGDINKENNATIPHYELEPTDIWRKPPAKIPNKGVLGMKPVGEYDRSLSGQLSLEWSASFSPQSPPPSLAPATPFNASVIWKDNVNAARVDLGTIYERKAKRERVRQWLASSQAAINQEDLKHVAKNHELFVINHVLYSEKLVIRHGWSSGEKAFAVANTLRASSKFQKGQTSDDAITIRSKDIGKRPIAYKAMALKVEKADKKTKQLKLALAKEQSQEVPGLCKQVIPNQSDSQQSSSSDEDEIPASVPPTTPGVAPSQDRLTPS